MNAYVTDRIARDHLDQMLADAALARRVNQVRKSRRAARRATAAATSEPADVTARPRNASRILTRPYAAFHAWLTAGLL